MKRYLLFFSLCYFNVAMSQDLATIKQRLITSYMTNPSKSSVDAVVSLMNSNGSFSDIANYSATNVDLRLHLTRLNILASAYKNSSNLSTYYNNTIIRNKYYLGLGFWIAENPVNSNWWYRQIAYPKEATKGFDLMADNMMVDNPTLYNNAVSYLMWGYNQNAHMDGANISDTIMGAIGAVVWQSNTTKLTQMKGMINDLLQINNEGEGFGADYMFAQHSGHGRQINTTSYGKEMYNSVLHFIEVTNGTTYAISPSSLTLLENGVLKALQWITFKNHYDPSTSGRWLNSNTSIASLVSISNRMLALNSPQNAALIDARNVINGTSSLTGNSMYWRLDYMIHRNANYMMSTRMTSTRTVSTESDGVSVGLNNFYTGAGVNYITVIGSEYDGSYFANCNYRQLPGTTVEQRTGALPVCEWGNGGTNDNKFAGGASNGTMGCAGMIWQEKPTVTNNLKAYKAWFYFPNETVALGAGISETGGVANVYTTLNQTNFNATEGVSYKKSGVVNTTTTPTTFSVVSPDWFYHGKVGYANLNVAGNHNGSQPFVVNTNNGLVSIAINHGQNPTNTTGKYSYVILPNATLAGMPALASGLTTKIRVDNNNASIQAVTQLELNATQVVFSSAAGGTLTIPATNESITVNVPCVLILDRQAGKIYVANPRAESAGTNVSVTYVNAGVSTTNTITFPTGNLSGSTVSFMPTNLLAVDSFNNDVDKANVVMAKNKLQITANFPIEKVAVYDMSGSLIHSFIGNGTQEIEESMIVSNGIYIVRINNNIAVKVINQQN